MSSLAPAAALAHPDVDLDLDLDLEIEEAFRALASGSTRPANEVDPALAAEPGALRLSELVTSDAWVSAEKLVAEVARRFFANPDLDALAVLEGGRPCGLLTRSRLLLTLAKSFGQELWAKKPVRRIAAADPLVLGDGATLEDAIQRALRRGPGTVYDEVIVVDGAGAYVGLLPVRDLVLHQSVALARSAADREAAEARSRDLEKLERLRAQFLAHGTHELRSPVNAIVSLAELLRRAADEGDLAKVRERIGLLQRSAVGLRGTVNNMLDLSKLEAGRTEVAIAPVELGPFLDEIAQTARLLLGAKPVEVRAAATPGASVATDRQKLRQIVLNLASNAAKFTERGRIELVARTEEDGVRIAVRDTGPGIRREDLARLFTPFGQLEDALTKAHEGTGLGLVITRSLATLLGGRVEVESRPGAGSTFTLHLPAIPPGSDAP